MPLGVAQLDLKWARLYVGGRFCRPPDNQKHEKTSRRPAMKIRNSLKSLKSRHRDCRVIRRRGRTYVINKTNRRFKARQG